MSASTLDLWHLPGLEGEIESVRTFATPDAHVELRWPRLRAGSITRLSARLREARERTLVDRPIADVIAAIDEATDRLTTGTPRETLLHALHAAAGFSPPMTARIVDRMAADWRRGPLEQLVAAELGNGDVLDRFVVREDRAVRALGPSLVAHVFAGNVPGVAVTSLIRALLVRSASVGKTAAGEPVLAALFAHALHDVDPALAACVAVTYWPREDEDATAEVLAAADTIVVYGGADTVAAVRRMAPASIRIVEHGPRISLGLVAADAATGTTAADVAGAVADFDQFGCVSPQIVYVERGGPLDPADFARRIAHALTELEAVLPLGRISAEDAARRREVVTRAEFRAIAGESVTLLEAAGALVIFDEAPAFEGSCLARTLRVKPVDSLLDVPSLIAPFRNVLQSAAIAGVTEPALAELATRLAAAGVTRITDFPGLPWPPAAWNHDGRGPLTELIRFIDREI